MFIVVTVDIHRKLVSKHYEILKSNKSFLSNLEGFLKQREIIHNSVSAPYCSWEMYFKTSKSWHGCFHCLLCQWVKLKTRHMLRCYTTVLRSDWLILKSEIINLRRTYWKFIAMCNIVLFKTMGKMKVTRIIISVDQHLQKWEMWYIYTCSNFNTVRCCNMCATTSLYVVPMHHPLSIDQL